MDQEYYRGIVYMCERAISNGSILWFSDLESLLFQEQIDSRVEDIGSSLLTLTDFLRVEVAFDTHSRWLLRFSFQGSLI